MGAGDTGGKSAVDDDGLSTVIDELATGGVRCGGIDERPADVAAEGGRARVRIVEDDRPHVTGGSERIRALGKTGVAKLVAVSKHIVAAAVEVVRAEGDGSGCREISEDTRRFHAGLQIAHQFQHADVDGNSAGEIVIRVRERPASGDAVTIIITHIAHGDGKHVGTLGDGPGDLVLDRIEVTAGLAGKLQSIGGSSGDVTRENQRPVTVGADTVAADVGDGDPRACQTDVARVGFATSDVIDASCGGTATQCH